MIDMVTLQFDCGPAIEANTTDIVEFLISSFLRDPIDNLSHWQLDIRGIKISIIPKITCFFGLGLLFFPSKALASDQIEHTIRDLLTAILEARTAGVYPILEATKHNRQGSKKEEPYDASSDGYDWKTDRRVEVSLALLDGVYTVGINFAGITADSSTGGPVGACVCLVSIASRLQGRGVVAADSPRTLGELKILAGFIRKGIVELTGRAGEDVYAGTVAVDGGQAPNEDIDEGGEVDVKNGFHIGIQLVVSYKLVKVSIEKNEGFSSDSSKLLVILRLFCCFVRFEYQQKFILITCL